MGVWERVAARIERARQDTAREQERPPDWERAGHRESEAVTGQVPYGVDLAAAWSWRLLVIGAAAYLVGQSVARMQLVVLPVVIALLLAALTVPVVNLLERWHLPRGLAAFVVVAGSLGLIALLLTFAGQQVANGANNLADQVVAGLDQIRGWLKHGPLNASDTQINDAIQQVQDTVTSSNSHVVRRLTEVGTTLGHIFAAFFIVLFSTYFFLYDGARIWRWVVRLFPRVSRARVDSSGRVAWHSLTRFVQATVLVAFTDALGIAIWAWVFGVPFVLAIGVLVFLGAFIPLVGATLSGSVAVLVALVAHGPILALVMLAGVLLVQQLEAHVLQPFLMGRFVEVHPLGVILAVGTGVLVGGVPGALVAVPLIAAVNAVVLHLAESAAATPPGETERPSVSDSLAPLAPQASDVQADIEAEVQAEVQAEAEVAGNDPRTGPGEVVP